MWAAAGAKPGEHESIGKKKKKRRERTVLWMQASRLPPAWTASTERGRTGSRLVSAAMKRSTHQEGQQNDAV